MSTKNVRKTVFLIFASLLVMGMLVPESRTIPVQGATPSDWNKDTFWYEPWGVSGVHKGIDIFAQQDTPVLASTDLIILHQSTLKHGGNVIVALGPKWRIHYFAHLSKVKPELSTFISVGETIGYVGDTGNAKGKPPHLHYSIISLLPLPWLMDFSTQGYKKAVYLNPIKYLSENK